MQDIAQTYLLKTDEELLELAGQAEQLTAEARVALKCELSRRRLDSGELSPIREGSNREIEGLSHGQVRPGADAVGVGEFVANVLRIYHDHFWFFFRLTAPSVLVGYIAIITARDKALEIAQHLPRGPSILSHGAEILEMLLANFAGYLASWMAFSFLFAAICSAVSQIEGGAAPSVTDSFAAVHRHLGSFLRLCVLLFFLLIVADLVGGALLLEGTLWILHQIGLHPSHVVMQLVSFCVIGLILLLLSRFALAVPAVILDDCRAGKAVFRSDELTEGKWLTLGALLAKSLIGSYVAGMCPFWLAALIPHSTSLPSWFSWVLTASSIVGVTVAEPPMFIGFGLLYLQTLALSPISSKAPIRQLA